METTKFTMLLTNNKSTWPLTTREATILYKSKFKKYFYFWLEIYIYIKERNRKLNRRKTLTKHYFDMKRLETKCVTIHKGGCPKVTRKIPKK